MSDRLTYLIVLASLIAAAKRDNPDLLKAAMEIADKITAEWERKP